MDREASQAMVTESQRVGYDSVANTFIVDLQCCVSFLYTKVVQLYTYTFSDVSFIHYYKIVNFILCAI